jgi:hypothetical protein
MKRNRSLYKNLHALVMMLLSGQLGAQTEIVNESNHRNAAGAINLIADSVKTNSSAPLRIVENRAFQAGEKLDFIVRYGRIVAGTSRLSIPEIVEIDGHPCYHILSEAWSNSFFSTFYKVEDKVQSYTDVQGIFTRRFEKRLREGHFKRDQYFDYDQVANLAKSKNDTVKVPPFVQDVLSAMYFVRTQRLAPGDSILIDNHDGKVYPLKIVVHRREKVNVRAGKFQCLVVEPFLQTPALFQQKGRVVVHLTDDHRKIPVMMTSQIYVKGLNVGSIIVELEKMSGVVK